MRYNTLEELRDAYEDDEISYMSDVLYLDNDDTFVYDGEEEVFSGGSPLDLLTEALDLLGIPWEHV